MPQRLDSAKSLRMWGLGLIVGACFCAEGAWAAAPAASQPDKSRSPVTRPAAASRPAATSQPIAGDFQAYYQLRLAETKPNDVEGLFSLALLCSTKDRPDLASDLCRKILENYPAHVRAKALLRASNMRRAAASAPSATSRSTVTQPTFTLAGVLSPEAVNRIRFGEFHVEDMTDRPRVSMSKQVIREFLDEAARNQAMTDLDQKLFNEGANDDKLRWMIKIAGGALP